MTSLLPDSTVAVTLVNRQRATNLDLAHVRALVNAAIPCCLEAEASHFPALLKSMPEVEVSLIGSRRMAREHGRFLGDPTVTDVITFPYGEILVCPAVAEVRGLEFGNSVEDETALYVIHGLLHLQGFDDRTPAAAKEMHVRQAKILKEARKSV